MFKIASKPTNLLRRNLAFTYEAYHRLPFSFRNPLSSGVTVFQGPSAAIVQPGPLSGGSGRYGIPYRVMGCPPPEKINI